MQDYEIRNAENDRQLSAIFSQFAGRVIGVTETPYQYRGEPRVRAEIVGDRNNPVIVEMNQCAQNVGLKLRVRALFPNTPRQLSRPEVIAVVEKQDDGQYRIGKFEGLSVINLKDFLP